MSNYLDLLNDDLIDKILGFVVDNIDIQLNKLTKKVYKLKYKLKPLSIVKSYLYEEKSEYLSIRYDNVSYAIGEYLFSNFYVKGNIVLIDIWNEDFCVYYGSTFISKKIYNPTYFEIIVEANKAIKKKRDYNHTFFKGLNEIFPDKVYEYAGILPKKNIRYFEICFR